MAGDGSSIAASGAGKDPPQRQIRLEPICYKMARACALLSLAASASALVAPVPAAKSAVAMNYQASEALPFMEKPEALDGTYAGDVGFDPFGFTSIFDVKWLCRARVFATSRGARR